MSLLDAGCKVSGICPAGHPLRVVTGVDSIYPYRALNSIGSLKAAIRAAKPDVVVPCDDAAVWQLHALHAEEPEFRPLIERSLGACEAYPTIESRSLTLQAARDAGITVPLTRAIRSAGELCAEDLEWPAVLKLDGTWGGAGVARVHSSPHAADVFPRLCGARRTAIMWKHFLAKRHPAALWVWRRRKGSPATLQKFISGREATTMLVCWQGEVLDSVAVAVRATQGQNGVGTILEPIENEEIERASRELARSLKLSGFHGLDFIIEETTGIPYLIELNPRATQLGHLPLTARGSLASVFAARLSGRTIPAGARRIQSETIAMFPHAWKTDPRSEVLRTGYHDVPWEQPQLVRELLRIPWPERRLLNRALNFLQFLILRDERHPDPPGDRDHAPLPS